MISWTILLLFILLHGTFQVGESNRSAKDGIDDFRFIRTLQRRQHSIPRSRLLEQNARKADFDVGDDVMKSENNGTRDTELTLNTKYIHDYTTKTKLDINSLNSTKHTDFEKLCESQDGRRLPDGAEWHQGDCTFCECRKGKTLCSVEDCQITYCENPIKVPGQCCPICLDTSCDAGNGTVIKGGEVWKEGRCTHCYCAGGEKKCAEEKCPYINCSNSYRPENKCCYRCTTGVQDCVVSDWGSWNDCPRQECGGGMRKRFRSIVTPFQNGGAFCPHMSEAEMCPRRHCDILPFCPVTEWGEWGHCTSTCGNGRRMRTRYISTDKVIMTSLMDCSQTHMQETKHCYAGSCTEKEVIGNSSEAIYDDICYNVTWTAWSECSKKCGGGFQHRRQELVDDTHPRGHLCRLLVEKATCNENKCSGLNNIAGNCKVSSWTNWSSCSNSCGHRSKQTKRRRVLHSPVNGGRQCPRLTVTRGCKRRACHKRARTTSNKCLSGDGLHSYNEGELWLAKPCISCQCINMQVRCEEIYCQPVLCANATRLPGMCCEFCSE